MTPDPLYGAWRQITWYAENKASAGDLDGLTEILAQFEQYRRVVDVLHQRCQRGFYLND